MGSIITSQKGILSASESTITVTINNETVQLQPGQEVPAGAQVTSNDDVSFVITFDDGTIFNSDETLDNADAIDQVADQATLDEIEALQELIASGEDPTEELPETAAGTPTANDGDSGYVAVSRDGSETLADNGYDTTGEAATPTAVSQEESISENDSPSVLINDAIIVGEDQIAAGNVLSNDTDADSALSVVSFEINGETYAAGTEVTLEGGVLVINEDGSYTFTPNENWNGSVPVITYTTNTGVTATLTIEVTPVDDASVLVNDSNTVAEDTVATGNVLDNDNDVDSDLSVVSFEVNGETYAAGTEVTLEGGVLVINEDGSYTFTPNENWNGSVPVITYTTNTGVTATLTIEVTPVDDASVLVNDSNTVAEDTVATGNVLDNDSDVDSDLSVVSFEVNGETYAAGTEVTLEGGVLVINEDGSYTFTPNENWNGSVPVITYTTNTGATATLTIEITPVDDPTVAVNDVVSVAEDTPATGNVLDNDSDPDSDLSVVSFEVNGETYAAGTEVTLEGGVLVINEDGSYTFTPNENWNGSVPVITYTTNTGATATLTIEITPVDDPTVAVNDVVSVAEDTPATGNVLDNDSDPDSDLSVVSFEVNGETYAADTEVTLEGGVLVINEDGSYIFTPNENWNGSVPVITYTTNTGATATLTIEITPVDDPTVAVNDVVSVAEDTPATGNVLDNDSDPDSDLSVVSFEVNGETYAADTEVTLEGGVLVINEDGSYIFTPNENWNGSVPVITYTTNTGATATLTIEITPVDDPTVAVNDVVSVAEDTPATGNVLDNDSDVDSDLSVVSFEVNGETYAAGTEVTLEGGVLVINEDGSYTFTPNENWNGSVPVITYTTNTGATATLTIEITPVDDPTVAVNDVVSVAEDTPATGNVLDNDSDPDSDLSVVSFEVDGQSHDAGTEVTLEGGVLVINEDGSYTFTPNENWNGSVPVITYTTNTGATATLTIEITPVDDPTVTLDDTNIVEEDVVATGNVLLNDSDPDSDLSVVSFTVGSDATVYSAGESVVVENGILVINTDGSYSFTPAPDWNGILPTITYTTNTGANATLTITVTPQSDPTIAVNDTITIQEDSVATGNVLTNDSDIDSILTVQSFVIDGDNNTYQAGTSVTLSQGVLLLSTDGTYSFTPNTNWNGQVPVITYTTNTGATATLTITVTPEQDPATISPINDAGIVTEDGASDTDPSTVEVVSGSLQINDPDAGEALFQVQTNVADGNYGTFSIDESGNWSYTLNNSHIDVQSLKEGETLTRTITV
ncbi:retention module-containing protein, partial [Shewanella inventionis]